MMSTHGHSSSSCAEPMLPPPGVSPLLHILRTANARYSSVAAVMRASQKPTHHARKRAKALQLTLNIERARACNPTWVSNIPLPILERDEQGDQEVAERQRAAPVPRRIPIPTRIGTTYAQACAGAAGKTKAITNPAPQVNVAEVSALPVLHLHLSAPDTQTPSACCTPAFSAGSSGSEESAGPSTPDSGGARQMQVPLKISIKRKPSPSLHDDAIVVDGLAEKRPKYGHKHWTRGRSHRA